MLKETAISFLAKKRKKAIVKWSKHPVSNQKNTFKKLIAFGKKTVFGNDHNFINIKSYKAVSYTHLRADYEGIKKYISEIKEGRKNVLWPGLPKYFAVTSGTTSGEKHIPITKESLPNLLQGATDAILMYVANSRKTDIFNGKFIFLPVSYTHLRAHET